MKPRTPLAIAVPALLGALLLLLPLVALVADVPWSRLWDLLSAEPTREALWLSLRTATLATVVALVVGVPLAWVLARSAVRGKGVLRALVLLPLVMPPVVGGVALLSAFGRNGLVGGPVHDVTGHALPFTTAGVVVAEAFVATPFLVIAVEGALRSADERYDEVAATLGARPLTVVRRVTLPLVAPGVLAGAALAWARALGEFGATITFAGSLPGRTQTLPLAVYQQLEVDRDAALALSVLLLAAAACVLLALRHRWLVPR